MFSFIFHILYSLVSFIVGAFFILLGIIALLLPWSSHIRTDMIEFILENSIAISLFGFGFAVIGLIMLINLYLGAKRRYYYVRSGKKSIAIDEEVIRQYLEGYWKEAFPNQEIPSHFVLKKNKIKITADLPFIPVSQRRAFIERIQEELQDLFIKLLGYSNEFILAVSFQVPKIPKAPQKL